MTQAQPKRERRLTSIAEDFSLPLTEAQKEMWLAARMSPVALLAYNKTLLIRLRGNLKRHALLQCLQELVDRHDALRTSFDLSEPKQYVAASIRVEVPFVDLTQRTQPEQEAELFALVQSESDQSFDVSKAPLLRARLAELSPSHHVLLLTSNHLVADPWSVGTLLDELKVLYANRAQGISARLAPAMQFREYVRLLNEPAQRESMSAGEAYWLQQFADRPTPASLPTDFPRAATRTYFAGQESRWLGPDLCQMIRTASTRQKWRPETFLLAGFKVLVNRLTGQEDLVVAIPAAGQTAAWLQDWNGNGGLVGHCEKLLPVRSCCRADRTFTDYLNTLESIVLDAYKHQDLTHGSLLRRMSHPQDPGHAALVSVVFSLDRAALGFSLHELDTEVQEAPRRAALFDLELNIIDFDKDLRVTCTYSDLFAAHTIQRWLSHYHTLLADVLANPDKRLWELALLNTEEQRQILVEWNRTEREYSRNWDVPGLFETQVERTPQGVAVEFEGKGLAYSELNHRANQLAHRLKSLGVGPDVLVGICMERSLDAVVGLLAVLKAGGAYVPLDPAYPDERLRFMLEDGNIQVLLTQESLLPRLAECRSKIMALDSEWESIAQESGENPLSLVTPDHLAYVIYTSGSTGKPKGVMIPHRAFLNYVVTFSRDYELGPNDRVLQFASLSFDASVEEIFPCLTSGARLVLRTDGMLESASVFLRRCEDWGITVLSLPTAYWHELTAVLEAETLRIPESLRLVVIGGERAIADRLSLWQKHVSQNVRLINSYGPTETTVVATAADLSRIPTNNVPHEVPIGRPIPNAQTYVLDRTGQPVLIGVPGELYIGGIGLARGYLSRPDLTAERFLPNAFSNDPGARVYKTGDLARYLPDGNLEYVGRLDDQIKIRGFRIELGEIEAALCRYSGVDQAVVTCREDTGEKRLVAYFTVNRAGTSVTELRNFLKSQVPEYMVPAVFVRLDRLPLTANGKVDRRALPEPVGSDQAERNGYCPPRDRLEQQLVNLWESVLQVENPGVMDNFFDLGGHSLLAVKLLARINQSLGRNLPLVSVFQAPTIEQMAQLLRQQGWKPLGESLVVVQPNGSKPPFFCVHGFAGCARLAAHLGPDQPVYGLVQGLDGNRFFTRVEELAAHYLNDIKAICPEGPYFLGGHSFGGLVAFEMAQQLRKAGDEVGLLALFDPDLSDVDHQSGPGVSTFKPQEQSSSEWLGSRVLRHLRQLQRLPRENRAAYFLERFRMMLTLLGRKCNRMICQIYLRLGWSMPPNLRTFFIREILFVDIYRAASKAYRPKGYEGRTVLIVAEKKSGGDLRVMWSALIPDGLISYSLPGDHAEILQEPHVGVLAGHLRNSLNEALQGKLFTVRPKASVEIANVASKSLTLRPE